MGLTRQGLPGRGHPVGVAWQESLRVGRRGWPHLEMLAKCDSRKKEVRRRQALGAQMMEAFQKHWKWPLPSDFDVAAGGCLVLGSSRTPRRRSPPSSPTPSPGKNSPHMS